MVERAPKTLTPEERARLAAKDKLVEEARRSAEKVINDATKDMTPEEIAEIGKAGRARDDQEALGRRPE